MAHTGRDVFIDWPPGWRDSPGFLDGIPFFSSYARIVRNARHIMSMRTYETFCTSWANSGLSVAISEIIASQIHGILKTYIKWPNYYFIPFDRAAIILALFRNAPFEPIDILDEVQNCFFPPLLNAELKSSFYELALNARCIEVFYFLASLWKTSNPDHHPNKGT